MANLLLIVFINFVGIGALTPVLPFTVIEGLGHSEIVMTALLLPCLSPILCWAGSQTRWAGDLFCCSLLGLAQLLISGLRSAMT